LQTAGLIALTEVWYAGASVAKRGLLEAVLQLSVPPEVGGVCMCHWVHTGCHLLSALNALGSPVLKLKGPAAKASEVCKAKGSIEL
jgi:hypothetical protein